MNKNEPRLTCLLNHELKERVKNTVYWCRGHPHNMTLARLCALALEAFLEEWEAEHNKGKPYPKRAHELRPGRPEGK